MVDYEVEKILFFFFLKKICVYKWVDYPITAPHLKLDGQYCPLHHQNTIKMALKKFVHQDSAVAGSISAEEYLNLPSDTVKRNDSKIAAQLAYILDVKDKIFYKKDGEKGASYGLTTQGYSVIEEAWNKLVV